MFSCNPFKNRKEEDPHAHLLAWRSSAGLTWCSPIRKLGLPGAGQLEEWEEVAGVPVTVQVGVQARLLAPWGVPGAVLEAQLIVHLRGGRPRRAPTTKG